MLLVFFALLGANVANDYCILILIMLVLVAFYHLYHENVIISSCSACFGITTSIVIIDIVVLLF